MNYVFVTSFNEKLYKSSGQAMVESFLTTNTHDLLVVYEDFVPTELSGVRYLDIHSTNRLKSWLESNKDIIPKKYGGCCPGYITREKCYKQHDFNKEAARWYRKIISIKVCKDLFATADGIIFVDCDTIFSKPIQKSLLEDLLSNCDVFYHLGKLRKSLNTGIESGIIGFNLRANGGRFIDKVDEMYTGGTFRASPRWDDGYFFRWLLENDKSFVGKDLTPTCTMNNVIDHGPFQEYMKHFKGKHAREGVN